MPKKLVETALIIPDLDWRSAMAKPIRVLKTTELELFDFVHGKGLLIGISEPRLLEGADLPVYTLVFQNYTTAVTADSRAYWKVTRAGEKE
jgi:hypothetical protein